MTFVEIEDQLLDLLTQRLDLRFFSSNNRHRFFHFRPLIGGRGKKYPFLDFYIGIDVVGRVEPTPANLHQCAIVMFLCRRAKVLQKFTLVRALGIGTINLLKPA